jgi:transcriptional regulator with XRE-family HTH domain
LLSVSPGTVGDVEVTELSIGERVRFFRRRRGLSQVVLAGLVNRSENWLSKVENGHIPVDRDSVISEIARALDVRKSDLTGQGLLAVNDSQRGQSTPALTASAIGYGLINPRFGLDGDAKPLPGTSLPGLLDGAYLSFQAGAFAEATARVTRAIPSVFATWDASRGKDRVVAATSLAYLYQLAANICTKTGAVQEALMVATAGDGFAQRVNDPVARISLQRSIAHSLLSRGQYATAAAVVEHGLTESAPPTTPEARAVLGSLALVGAMAAARANARSEAATFLQLAEDQASLLKRKPGNLVWTSFGPSNVIIHRTNVAAELGDYQRAVVIGGDLDTSNLPRERQVRHRLELARCMDMVGKLSEARAQVFAADRIAPDQTRTHFLTRELLARWVRAKGKAKHAREIEHLAKAAGVLTP